MFVQYLSERQQAALLHYSYEMIAPTILSKQRSARTWRHSGHNRDLGSKQRTFRYRSSLLCSRIG